ncbi:MAG: polysaccharide deacetylase family protein [Salibacteraceae bacterium]
MIYPKFIPRLVSPLVKPLTLSIKDKDKVVYLTFDDGPHPEITPWVCEVIAQFDAKATFFFTGQNAANYGDVVKQTALVHSVGNHTFDHPNGWNTPTSAYVENVFIAGQYLPDNCNLFRPPYGKITPSQIRKLRHHYHVILWNRLSADFDARCSAQDCVRFATKSPRGGNIIVFHDSEKAWPRLRSALPRTLEFYSKLGYRFASIRAELL